MAKVFTITEGIENLGALKTGGQGSVYKGKKTGEIITAIKLLPTPIHTEDAKDKNYRAFQNEVKKLQKVNENPNPNVVSIMGFGITETGSLPYIEMEFIEGSDLSELLKPPHEPIFSIHEVIKVALHLSNALAHCHKCDVKHGDIKSNNVKYNERTGNYMLLDFGLALMSDEDRRTSLRHAGAIEFMAPEQNEGKMLFQTDVYSFGVIIFELLAGIVPFPLHDSGETARNAVMVSHMEIPPPDVLELREKRLPKSWTEDQSRVEMQVPSWLLAMMYKCLEKKPEDRYDDGIVLHDYILTNTLATNKLLTTENISDNDEDVHKQLVAYKTAVTKKEEEIKKLQTQLAEKDSYINKLKNKTIVPQNETAFTGENSRKTVSKSSFITVLAIAGFLGAFLIYSLFISNNKAMGLSTSEMVEDSLTQKDNSLVSNVGNKDDREIKYSEKEQKQTLTLQQQKDSAEKSNENVEINNDETTKDTTTNVKTPTTNEKENADTETKYKVNSKAYFHDKPDPETRRDAFIVHWNNAVLKSQGEANGFIYVVFTNHLGQTSRGWLSKKDLSVVKE